MILFGPTILKKNGIFQVCVSVCVCVYTCTHVWNGRPRAIGAVKGKLEKEKREFQDREKKGERRKQRPLFSFLSQTVSRFGCFWVQNEIRLSWSRKCPQFKYLQLIMLQLLVFPFSLPSSQMILKKNHSFKKLFFQCWKNMEKLLNSLRALRLSIFTVSRWIDKPESQRWGRQAPLC